MKHCYSEWLREHLVNVSNVLKNHTLMYCLPLLTPNSRKICICTILRWYQCPVWWGIFSRMGQTCESKRISFQRSRKRYTSWYAGDEPQYTKNWPRLKSLLSLIHIVNPYFIKDSLLLLIGFIVVYHQFISCFLSCFSLWL